MFFGYRALIANYGLVAVVDEVGVGVGVSDGVAVGVEVGVAAGTNKVLGMVSAPLPIPQST